MPTRSSGRVRRLPARVGADASPSVWPYVCSPEWSCCFWPSSSPRAPIRLRPRHSIEPHRHSQSKAAGRRRGYRLWGGPGRGARRQVPAVAQGAFEASAPRTCSKRFRICTVNKFSLSVHTVRAVRDPLGTDRRPAHFSRNTPTKFCRTSAMTDRRLPHCEKRR